jgi:long-chain fatty acid transport protein
VKAAALAAAVWSASALAAGFGLPEQTARAIGTGGTGTASAEGAAAVFYNPGSIGFEDGFSAEVSGIFIVPRFRYEPPGAGTATSPATDVFALPSVFLEVPVSAVHLGLGAFANYGLGIRWPAGFDGRFDASASKLQTFTVNPAVAMRVHEHLSIGVGVDLVRGTVELTRQLDFVDSEGTLRLGGGAWGFGANAGVSTHWLSDALVVGLSYRSAVALNFTGRADFTVPKEFQEQLADRDVTTSLVLPHTVSLGGAFRVTPRVRLSLDATYTTWSSLRSIELKFGDPALDTSLQRKWFNTVTFRAGAELGLWSTSGKELSLRLGTGFDPSPSPGSTLSPSLPDATRVIGSTGLGYRLGNFSAELGYMFVFLLPRSSTPPAFPAYYAGTAHVLGASIGFKQ